MPFRRRPQEPSPRLLAVLAASERLRARSEGTRADEERGAVHERGAVEERQASELTAGLIWLPERADLLPLVDPAPAPRPGSDARSASASPRIRPRTAPREAAVLPGHVPPGYAPPGRVVPGPQPLGQQRPRQQPPDQQLPDQWVPGQRPAGQQLSGQRRPGRHRRPRPPGPAVFTLPHSVRSARLFVRGPAVVGLAAVLAVAVAVFGVRVAWARAESRPTVLAPGAGEPSSALERARDPASGLIPASVGTAARPGGQVGQDGRVVVHVVGQVKHPGVVTLAAGSRVGDALRAAGGALPGADLSAVNLARLLVDGEQIRVPKPGEVVPQVAGGSPGSLGGSAGGLVNLNTADLPALDTLPGVGPVLAQRVLDWRAEHGRFSRVDELGEVSGIGDKLLAQLTPKVTV